MHVDNASQMDIQREGEAAAVALVIKSNLL